MAIVVKNTNYNGEVLEQILTLAATGNEIVEKGLIMVIPGVEKKISLPRLKSGKMLQKRKEHPGIEDSKGNFNYSEKSLDPVDFMAFTVFNPRAYEQIWRKWQPKGNLVFAELPPEGQNALLAELTKQVKKYGEGGKVAIRNIRREAMENFKKQQKASEITEDELKMAEKDLQKLTDDSCKELDKLLENKEKELLSV